MIEYQEKIMKLLALGDSITVGTFTAENDISPNTIASPNFVRLCADALGFDEVVSLAQNGTCISATGGPFPADAISKKIDLAPSADAVILAGGTNDYAAPIALGTPEDREDVSFYGGLWVLFSKLKARYPIPRVYVISPIRRQNHAANAKGHSLDDYRTAIKHRCAEFGFNHIDGYGVPIYPEKTEHRALYIKDGLHPNVLGHKLYAEYLISSIRAMDNCKE
jgi:lysophospholipase L1-like esterase